MIATIKIYDEHVRELLKRIDERARKFDAGKYGLPPEQNLERIVYKWVYEMGLITGGSDDEATRSEG